MVRLPQIATDHLARSHVGIVFQEPNPVVCDTKSVLYTTRLGWARERAGHCPAPDEISRDENAPHTALAHGTGMLPQLLADRGLGLALRIAQSHMALNLLAQDAVHRHQVRIAQQQFLVY